MAKIIIAPSILSANLGTLSAEISEISNAGADWLHIDVMDGSFVPPITFGDNIVKLAKRTTNIFLDVHLMISNPEQHIKSFAYAGADLITVHVEACTSAKQTLQAIRSTGAKAGLSIKPGTALESVFPFLDLCDLILIMTVEPGWSGQEFMPDMLAKVSALKAEIEQRKLSTLIEVDGGINAITAKTCITAGANVLVAGSYIFGSSDRKQAIQSLTN